MYPTRGQVKDRFSNILDDPLGLVFDETVFAPAFGEAFDALFNSFLQYQVPNIEITVPYTVVAGTISLAPTDMSIPNFGDFIYLAERPNGSSGRFRELIPVDRLPQRDQGQTLGVFNYSGDAFHFVGATGDIELQLAYDASGQPPTLDTSVIGVDGSLTFLSNYAVGAAGPRKGYAEVGASSRLAAVGPRYDQGVLGGELFRLVQTRVRSRQKVPIVPKRFSVTRRGRRGATAYVPSDGVTSGSDGGYGVGPLGGGPLGS